MPVRLPELLLRLAPTRLWHLSHQTVNQSFAFCKHLSLASRLAPGGSLNKHSAQE